MVTFGMVDRNLHPKTYLSEILPILDFGLAVSSGQTTRQYFANFSNSPNLGKSTISFVEYDTPNRLATTRLQLSAKQQVDCCILVSHSILPSMQWIDSHSFVSGSQRSLQRSMQPNQPLCMLTSVSLFCLLRRQQINCINHGKNHRSHRAIHEGLSTSFSKNLPYLPLPASAFHRHRPSSLPIWDRLHHLTFSLARGASSCYSPQEFKTL